MKYALIVDVSRCSNCFSCQVACKDEYVGNAYPPYSYPQPDKNQAWIRIVETEKGKHPYPKFYPIPLLCMHCADAPCMKACPVEGCIYRTAEGVVLIDPEKCDGCKCCIDGCPYGVIFLNEDKNICQKCTLCMHRLKEGQEPACIDACPSGVFTFGEEKKILEEAKKRGAKVMYPELKTKPRIYYIGLPYPTIAGHIVDGKTLMDVTGAKVTIASGANSFVQESNVAGNFAIDDLKMDGKYSVKIECKGYRPKTIVGVRLDNEYKHLGEIKIDKS